MTFKEYSDNAEKTKNYKDLIIYPTLGISGESGEVAEKVKKILRDNNGMFLQSDKLEIAKELGDVLWYVNALAIDLGFTLEDIARLNNEKLLSRLERGVISGSGDNR